MGTITTRSEPASGGSISYVITGTQIKLTATPKPGYVFVRWTDTWTKPGYPTRTAESTLNPWTDTLNPIVPVDNFVAYFAPVPVTNKSVMFGIIPQGSGVVSIDGRTPSSAGTVQVEYNKAFQIVATPSQGFKFKMMEIVGTGSAVDRKYTSTVTYYAATNLNITVHFESTAAPPPTPGTDIGKMATLAGLGIVGAMLVKKLAKGKRRRR